MVKNGPVARDARVKDIGVVGKISIQRVVLYPDPQWT